VPGQRTYYDFLDGLSMDAEIAGTGAGLCVVAATVVVLAYDRQSTPAGVAYEEPGQQVCHGGLAPGEQVPARPDPALDRIP
jgi:hypothetical protein